MSDPDKATNWFDPGTTTFGDRLTAAREGAGLSQEDLARQLGIKVKTIRAWEADQSAPRANRLSILCGLMNVPLVWLMTGHGAGPDGEELATEDGALLQEIEALRRDAGTLSERLAVLETRLRVRLEEEA